MRRSGADTPEPSRPFEVRLCAPVNFMTVASLLPPNPSTPSRARRVLTLGMVASLASAAGCTWLPHETGEPIPPVEPGPDERQAIPPFSTAPADGRLPPGWAPYVLRKDKRPTRYEAVSSDRGTVLRARADRAATGAYTRTARALEPGLALRWSWRTDALIDEADVSDYDLDDSPARVALSFDGDKSQFGFRDKLFYDKVKLFTGVDLPWASLMYVWDAQAPVGTVISYKHTSRIKYLVVESGSAGLGRWLAYERDLLSDFERVFGERPRRLDAVGVLTDTDDLGAVAETLYGDLSFT